MSIARKQLDAMFATIREAAGPATWSTGVDLARQDAVTGERQTEEEIVLRVLGRDATVSRSVSLFINDQDWTCDCNGRDDPCAHICAGIIAVKRAAERREDMPRSAVAAVTLDYAFTRTAKGLVFERIAVASDGKKETLTASLSAILSGRVKGPPVSPTQDDLAIEMALGNDKAGLLPSVLWRKLLPALKPFQERGGVTLDGKPIQVSAEPVGLQAVVVDDAPGVRLFAEQDPAITESFANGVALCGQTLRPIVLPVLDPLQRELLRTPRFYGLRELVELAAEILPRLQNVIKLDIRTSKLPGMTRAEAGVEIQLNTSGKGANATMRVSPRVVYFRKSEVLAYLHSGRLVATGSSFPARLPDEEKQARERLTRELGMHDSEPFDLRGEAAALLVSKLRAWEKRGPGRIVSGPGLEEFKTWENSAGEPETLQGAVIFTFDDVDVSFKVHRGTSTVTCDSAQVMAAWRRGDSLVPLLDGGWAPLPRDWLERYGDTIDSLLQAKLLNAAEGGKVPRSLLPSVAALAKAMNQQVDAGLERFAAAVMTLGQGEQGEQEATLACTRLRADLRSYQREGVKWLAGLKSLGLGGVLADDMGLGKTIQTLAVLAKDVGGGLGKTLVVAPTSVLPNWQRETERFRPDLRVHIYHGISRDLDGTQADVILTTYALLRRDLTKLKAVKWAAIVLDEAQAVKNPESQVTQAAHELSAEFRLCLSGTPVENSLDDAWSLFHFSCPGLLGTRKEFTDSISKKIMSGDAIASAMLRERIKPFLMRRLKKDVAVELPPRTDMVLYAELSPSERERYDAIKAATRADVVAKLEAGGSVLMALEALLRLRQAACHQALLPGVEASTSSKLELLITKLTEVAAEGHKALVFSQWTGFLDLIEPALKAAGLTYLRLDGATTNRGEIVERFQQGDVQLLIMSLKAGGVGLNLTAADHVFLMDPWWNPAVEDQAADRAHRIGQDKPVMAYKLVATDTVEERILELQEKKRALAASVIGTEGAQGASLSRAELLNLLM